MPLATNADVNAYLPQDKAELEDASDDLLLLGAEREIKATLAGVVSSTTLASWVSPSNTPGIVREICARLTAGMWYTLIESEDDAQREYGVDLKNEARALLAKIVAGEVVILDTDDTVLISTGADTLVQDDFLPNDATTAIAGGERKFGMGDSY
jgi:hypothetical protein